MPGGRERALDAFRDRFGRPPEFLVRAPGRVNLLGEHVDYNDGLVLPAAIDREAWIAAAAARGGLSTLVAADLRKTVAIEPSGRVTSGAEASWHLHPLGIVRALARRGLGAVPIEAVLTSDVPIGAGLSSSAAVGVAFALAWKAAGGFDLAALDVARICQEAERQTVGVDCGLMDPIASLAGRAGHALLFDCRSLRTQDLPLRESIAIVVADTRVPRRLGATEYNRRREECAQAVERLRAARPAIVSLRDAAVEDLEILPETLRRRARHVVEEIGRVATVVSMPSGDRALALGKAMIESHTSLRDLYEVSCPELDVMVEEALSLPGCHGSRLTGAGFGGCTVSLVEEGSVARFCDDLALAYEKRTGVRADVWRCRASDGAQTIRT